MRRTHLCTALLAVALAGAAGCIIDTGPELRITDLRVTGETDQWGYLEVEVHMFDAVTHEHLGCSGQNEGLERVDHSDVSYHLDAWFRDPHDDVPLEPWILNGRMVELQVSEDDDVAGCPAPPANDDDMIGISGPVDRAMVENSAMLVFDRVMGLRVVID